MQTTRARGRGESLGFLLSVGWLVALCEGVGYAKNFL